MPIALSQGLRERSYGAFQGHDSDEIAARFPDEYAQWQTRDPGFAPPDGESLRAFYHRVLHALEPIVAAHPNGRIACIAHGGVLDCVYRFAHGLSLDAPRNYALLNTSINIVDFDSGNATVCVVGGRRASGRIQRRRWPQEDGRVRALTSGAVAVARRRPAPLANSGCRRLFAFDVTAAAPRALSS